MFPDAGENHCPVMLKTLHGRRVFLDSKNKLYNNNFAVLNEKAQFSHSFSAYFERFRRFPFFILAKFVITLFPKMARWQVSPARQKSRRTWR
jgi:hypothetical protein